MKRGEIWIANLYPKRGREAGKIRPVLVMQADTFTEQGTDTIIIIPITSKFWPKARSLRIHVPARNRLARDSYVMIEKIRALDSARFGEGPLAVLTSEEMARVERSLLAVLGMYR
jgi:mRNA interferase MazF